MVENRNRNLFPRPAARVLYTTEVIGFCRIAQHWPPCDINTTWLKCDDGYVGDRPRFSAGYVKITQWGSSTNQCVSEGSGCTYTGIFNH